MTDLDRITHITLAQDVITALVEELSGLLQAKGYPKAFVEIWIGRNGGKDCHIFVGEGGPRNLAWGGYNLSLVDAAARFRTNVAALPHRDAEAMAYAEELSAPLFLLSEHQDAAE